MYNVENRAKYVNKLDLLYKRELSRHVHIYKMNVSDESLYNQRREICVRNHPRKYVRYLINLTPSIQEYKYLSANMLNFNSNEIVVMHQYIGIIIAFCSMIADDRIPPYVLMWILDWFDRFNAMMGHIKIQTIENIRNKYRLMHKIDNSQDFCS